MKSIWKVTCIAACFVGASTASQAEDVTYRKDIKPLVEAKCIGCHGPQSPSLAEFKLDEKKYKAAFKGPRIDTYEHLLMLVGWPDAGAIMRRLDDGKSEHAGGKPGNMNQYLGSSDEERQKNLRTFKAWVGEGGWNLNRFKARGKVPGITKAQFEKVKVKY